MKRQAYLIIFFAITFLSACKEGKKKYEGFPKEYKNHQALDKDIAPVLKKTDTKLIINENSFLGFKIGDKIISESKNLKKNKQENGEGSFWGYEIFNDKGEKVGFIFPKHNDKRVINIIEINSPEYKTKSGIGVGSTYQDLKNKYPNIETHGSEVESRTTSNVEGMYFELDARFNTYEIDESKIKSTTKITKITLRPLKS